MQDFRLKNVGRRPKQERMPQAAAPETRGAGSLEDQLFGSAAPTEQVEATAKAEGEVLGLAGPVRRIMAVLLNGVFFVLVAMAIFILAAIFSLPVNDRALGVLYGVIFAVYFAGQVFAMARCGQSWGKRLLGVKVVDAHNRPLSWGRVVFGRELFWLLISLVPFLGWLVPPVCVVMLFANRRRQTLQDQLAQTVVVRVRAT